MKLTHEEAYKAGYKAAAERARAFHPIKLVDTDAHMQASWEEWKDLHHEAD